MRACKCDRCRRFYDYASKDMVPIFITTSCSSIKFVQDLCDECQKELEAWWNAGKAEMEVEE